MIKSGGLIAERDVVEEELHLALSQVDLRLNGQADLTEFIQVLISPLNFTYNLAKLFAFGPRLSNLFHVVNIIESTM